MVWLVCITAGIQIIIVLLTFTMFSLLPKWDAPPSNFWQWISHTVGCIPANKPSIASCFSHALTMFYSPAWNSQSSKFWQRISLPVLLALADYWSRGVWIILQVPLTPGLSQVINWIALGGVWWVGQETSRPCSNHPNCHALTAWFADLADIPGLPNITTGRCLWFVWLQWYNMGIMWYKSI